jgi:hypothetical protein
MVVLWLLFASGYGSASSGRVYVEAVVGQPSRINPLFAAQNDADADLAALVLERSCPMSPSHGRRRPTPARIPS